MLRLFRPAARDSSRRLIASLFLTQLGFAMTSVGAALLVVDRFGLGVSAGVTLAVQVLPNVLAGPVVGELVSRRNPRSLAIGSSLIGALLVLAYPAAHTPAVAQIVALVVGLAVLPGIPARMALRSALVPPERQHRVSGQLVAAERTALVLGPLLAGGITAQLGYSAVFPGEAVLAVGAAVLLLRMPPTAASLTRPDTEARGAWRSSHARAARLVLGDRLLAEYTATAVTYSVGVGVRRLVLPALAVLTAGSAGPRLGLLVAALAVGGAVGGIAMGHLRPARPERWYLLLALGEAAAWPLLAVGPSGWALVVLAVAGLGEGASTALFFSRVQELVPPARIGRYFSVLSPATDAAVVAGLAVAAVFGGSDLPTTGALAIAVLVGAPVLLCPGLLRRARV